MKRLLILLFLLLLLPGTAGAADHYINAAVSGGSDDGSDWTNAWTTLPSPPPRASEVKAAAVIEPERTMTFIDAGVDLKSSPALAYQSSFLSCAPGDTCVYAQPQPGPLELPAVLGETPVVMLWSTTVQPRANVRTDRPIMQTVALTDTLVSDEGDTTYVGSTVEQESGYYYENNIPCAAVSLLLVAGQPVARLTWMNGFIEEYPLDRVKLYAVGRAE